MKKYLNFVVVVLLTIFSITVVSCDGREKGVNVVDTSTVISEEQARIEAEEKARIEAEEKERIKKEEEERLRKGEIIIGSNGEFYLNELKEEAYKKGYEDGFNGYAGYAAVNSFEIWLRNKLGTPQSNEQKETLKRYRDVLFEEYSRGRKEGYQI